MPAVNLSLRQTHSNVTLSSVPKSQLRLLYNIAVALLGVLFLLVLRSVSRKRYKSPPQSLHGQVDPAATGQQRLWLSFSEKSRGVSNWREIMPTNQDLAISQFRADGESDRIRADGNRDGSQERESRKGPREDSSASLRHEQSIPQTTKPRPPPPPPLTPPTLSRGVITFQDRRMSVAASTIGDLETTFIHQPNPDYISISPSPERTSTAVSNSRGSPSTPRRRSYTKMLSLGSLHPASSPQSEADLSSFAPSSFPSSSPVLPPPPHESPESPESSEIDVQGEIISVMDESGTGWKRHTRVYGGGVCLACMASGGHGDHGGFYGDSVPLDQRR